MKRLAVMTAIAISAFSIGAIAEEKHMDHGAMGQGTMDHGKMGNGDMMHQGAKSAENEATGVGVVNKVDLESKMVNITHEPMPQLGWPTMTMDLATTKQADISAIKAGDKVKFTLKLGRDKQYRITGIAPAE
ncbi:MAG: copper-binding protein [Hyphomicrobiaceae bacterium]|nr:copper-binding protein [Hyphomicrobiaceae bacterium]